MTAAFAIPGEAVAADVAAALAEDIGTGDVTAARVRGGATVGSIGSGDFDL